MKKMTDDEFGILITREMKSMMLDSTITYEQRAKIFCAIVGDEELKDAMSKSFANSLKVGYLTINNKRKAEILSRRKRQKQYAKDKRASTEISEDKRASLNKTKQSKAKQNKAKHSIIPPKSPEGLKGGNSTSSEPASMLDDPAASLGLPADGSGKGTASVRQQAAVDPDVEPDEIDVCLPERDIARYIEATYRYKVNAGKLRKCLKSVLKKNSAAEVLGGYRRWLAVWETDDFQWAPSRITDWLYDAKFLEKPRRGNTRAAPQVDPDTVSSDSHLELV